MSTPNTSAFDHHMMTIALRMAARGLGTTAPNPSVGAVIADEATGELISRAVTAPGGRPHAEPQAILAAGYKAKGATIYVTLEPCAHHGRTGPCAEAIVAAGLKRAVIAITDPDPRVAGRGLEKMRAAGITVDRGVGAAEARWITRGHIVRVTERRPLVTLKLALNAEGEVARGNGASPVWVTGPLARQHGALLRAQSDAILAGVGTVRDDDPQLTCRLPGLFDRSPVRVVISSGLDISPDSKLVKSAREVPLWVATSTTGDGARRAQLEAMGAEIFDVTAVQGRPWLPSVMEVLVARGITRLLVEGGPKTWRAFADAAFVDEVVLYMAPQPDGGDVSEAVARTALFRRLGPLSLTLFEQRRLGPDTLWRFRHSTAR